MTRSFDCPKCGCPVRVEKHRVGDPHAYYPYTNHPVFLDWERVVICPNCGEELQVQLSKEES